MEGTRTTEASPGLALRFKNAAASIALTAIACAIYALAPYNQTELTRLYGWVGFSFTGREFLFRAAVTYAVLLLLYFLLEPAPHMSKSLRVVRFAARFVQSPVAIWRAGISRDDRLALLVTLLKTFFAPLMTMSLMMFLMAAIDNATGIANSAAFGASLRTLFDRHGYWFTIQGILFVDTLIFTVGYLVEMPRLRNEIRSVDPTLMGWTAAMICYPPFNHYTGLILGSPVSDFPRFDDPMVHVGLNVALLVLMATYASASVALGWKASNLTHRGVVASGPYRVIRHPAYTCKNMAWWIGAIPLVVAEFSTSAFAGLQAAASMVAWSMIYVLRALTEEDHLRSVDGEYAAYAARVRYRFIPGVY